MSKKTTTLVLAVFSATFLALPAMASAQEIHLEPAEAFSVSGIFAEFRATGEPTITCEPISGSGA